MVRTTLERVTSQLKLPSRLDPRISSELKKTSRIPSYFGFVEIKDGVTSPIFRIRYCRFYYTTLYVYTGKRRDRPLWQVDLRGAREVRTCFAHLKLKFSVSDRKYQVKVNNESDFSRWLAAFEGATTLPSNQLILDVHFLDGTKIEAAITAQTTAEDLWRDVCWELSLEEDSQSAFFIWAVGASIEILLRNQDVVMDTLENWDKKYVSEYSKAPDGPPYIIFRKSLLFHVSEIRLRDFKVVYLLFSEAVFVFLINGYYLPRRDMHRLSGLIAQMLLGDARGDMRDMYVQLLRQLVPLWLIPRTKRKVNKLTQAIQMEHRKLRATPAVEVHSLFVEAVRHLPYYGAAFFRVQDDSMDKSEYFTSKSNMMSLGINRFGVHIFISRRHHASYAWKHVVYWKLNEVNKRYLYILTRSRKKSTYYVLKAPIAPIIDSYASSMMWEMRLLNLAAQNRDFRSPNLSPTPIE